MNLLYKKDVTNLLNTGFKHYNMKIDNEPSSTKNMLVAIGLSNGTSYQPCFIMDENERYMLIAVLQGESEYMVVVDKGAVDSIAVVYFEDKQKKQAESDVMFA
ncbi:MAG: hypothetical protein K8E24_014435 [Methanobacterium paludis]|nr:hypothetical protein [Methanobacterium paludis]